MLARKKDRVTNPLTKINRIVDEFRATLGRTPDGSVLADPRPGVLEAFLRDVESALVPEAEPFVDDASLVIPQDLLTMFGGSREAAAAAMGAGLGQGTLARRTVGATLEEEIGQLPVEERRALALRVWNGLPASAHPAPSSDPSANIDAEVELLKDLGVTHTMTGRIDSIAVSKDGENWRGVSLPDVIGREIPIGIMGDEMKNEGHG